MNTVTTFFTATKTQFAKHLLVTVMALFALVSTHGQTARTASSGPWNVATTWTPNGIPGTDDDVTIPAGVTVTVPANVICRRMYVSGTVNMTGTNVTLTISCNNQAGNTNGLQLNSGSTLNIGATNTVYFAYDQASGIVNNGGTIGSGGTNGIDGGTILVNTQNSGGFQIGGTSATTLYNLKFTGGSDGTSGATLRLTGPSLLINGTVNVPNNQWKIKSGTESGTPNYTFISPTYGPASTLYIDGNDQGISSTTGSPLSSDLANMWSATSGTIGTTPGYPNNVTIVNVGNSKTATTGWDPSGAVGLNGTLQIGDGTQTGRATLQNVTSFNAGGIIVNNNDTFDPDGTGGAVAGSQPSILIGPKIAFINRGNFTLKGTPVSSPGTFQNSTGGIMNLSGGVSASPQIISTTSGTVPLTTVIVSNNSTVQLNSPTSISNSLTLTSGYVNTSTTNLLTVSNSATTAISGGSNTAYVNGPLEWNIPAVTTGNYIYPVGSSLNGGAYLPFTLSPNTTTGSLTTVTAFNAGSGGSMGPNITALSTTEYWSVSTKGTFSSSPLANAQRPLAVAPFNSLAISTSSNGQYNTAGGTANGGAPGIISGGSTSNGTLVYVAMVNATLSVIKVSSTNYTCTGSTGTLVVAGSSGVPQYFYDIDGANTFANTTGIFTGVTAGNHTIRVRDSKTPTATTSAPVQMSILGSLVINGDNSDIIVCTNKPTPMLATNLQNTTPTYSWSKFASGTPVLSTANPYDPGSGATDNVTTTYYVTSDLYPTNLVTNGSFESGTTGWTTQLGVLYDYVTLGSYASTPTPADNVGYYSVSGQATLHCSWFSTNGSQNGPALAPQDGSNYLIVDGFRNTSKAIWSQTINVTTPGLYKFQYWYAAGNINPNRAQLQTTVTGGTLAATGTSTTAAFYTLAKDASNTNADPTKWVQATYTVNVASAGNVTLNINNTGAKTDFNSADGNDFFIDNIEFLKPCTVTSSIKVVVNCALPVELLYFNATKQGDGALLTWSTASEINSSYYIVEKSSDGTSFAPIGRLNAAGNSHSVLKYSFTDPSIYSGVTYYRLAQYDIDGSVHYSDIKAVNKTGNGDVLIVPNPSSGIFNVIFDRSDEVSSSIAVINMLGQIVYAQAESAGNSKNVDITSLSAGAYYLQISTDEGVIMKKVIKE